MIKKRFVLSMLLSGIILSTFVPGVVSANNSHQYNGNSTISEDSRAAQLVWIFKEENGKKYRRLYDKTNEKWLTNWILC